MPHTPGPWTVFADQTNDGYEVRDASLDTPHATVAVVVFHDDHEGETKANALLVAAAPDLLDACEGIDRLLLAHQWGEGPAWRAVRAAISKAKKGT